MDKRGVLLRLQNNIKLRRLRAQRPVRRPGLHRGHAAPGPEPPLLWREAGLMNQRLDRIGAALACLERSLELEPEGPAASRARTVLEELRHRLN